MPLTTRCRRCGRLFPVYAQQLKAGRGKLACPQCGGRFNAVGGLLDEVIPAEDVATSRRMPKARRRNLGPAPGRRIMIEAPSRRRARGGPLWLLGSLVLAVVLIAQIGWWERGHWLRDPQIHARLDGLCAMLGCRLPLPRIPGTIEILSPSLALHPEDPQALRLVLTLVNGAAVPQRLPLLQLELYDDARILTAARRFNPDGYLAAATPGEGLAPGASVNLMLDLAKPPETPAGFRVRLL
ncbi:MAG: DUF3426 domain-containing protein [Chromatiaceae bacterium]|jgi:hypothetical protein|nr:DUF3426 domain-containing protein [Chromatiaceae bacterium]